MARADPPLQTELLSARVPVIVGPTGIGKTDLAFRLALALDAEIVVADSRQVYRRLDIATNKPSPAQRRQAPYHMVDVADPETGFNAAAYVTGASAAIREIHQRGRLAIVEGGSMLYVDALCLGLTLTGIPPDPVLRHELAAMDAEALQQRLLALDPDVELDMKNPVRLVRAIEVLEAVGPPLTRLRTRTPPAWRPVWIGLTASLDVIDARLALRSRQQVERGLLDETRAALESGVPETAPVLSGIGYAEALACLRGEITIGELPASMARSNGRYARRQLRWWRRNPAVEWFGIDPDPLPGILRHVSQLKESA